MSIPLQATLLLSSNKSLRDVKSEMVLTMGLRFLEDYTLSLKKEENEFFGLYDIDNESKESIHNAVLEIRDYLRENVTSREKLVAVMSNASKSQKHMIIAKQYEPHGVFHDFLATSFQNKLSKGMAWVPELLAFCLISYYKSEVNKPFVKHQFIQEYDFSNLINIYVQLNLKLKKEMKEKNPKIRVWEQRTVIDSMFAVADKMIKDYFEKHYKVNTNRVSKTRKRK